MKKIIIISTAVLFCLHCFSQNVGIGTATPIAKLHIKGNADTSQLVIDANATQSNLRPLIRLRKADGTDLMHIHSDYPENLFIGLNAGRTSIGRYNTFLGSGAGYSNYTGLGNTGTGYQTLYANTGNDNTAMGAWSLYQNTLGSQNTANGYLSLFSNTTASRNTAIGSNALELQSYNNNGSEWVSGNTAVGYAALRFNQPTFTSNGINNTAVGALALYANTTGYDNSAMGVTALYSNTTGYENSAFGRQAMFYNTEGFRNVATGYKALRNNTTGSYNTAMGNNALENNTTALSNTAIGYQSLYNNTTGTDNVAIGTNALLANISGTYNIAIGNGAGINTIGIHHNTISIGNSDYKVFSSNYVHIGNNSSTAWIGGRVNWSTYSDARIKNNIKEDVKGLEFIMKLKPVTYFIRGKKMLDITGNKEDAKDYPGKYDADKIKHSGFLAQQVEQAAKEAGYDFDGVTHKPKNDKELYSLSYASFVVPLVKAVQEQQQQIEALKNQDGTAIVVKQQLIIENLQKQIALLEKRLAALETKK